LSGEVTRVATEARFALVPHLEPACSHALTLIADR
jgi:hypothetical protein